MATYNYKQFEQAAKNAGLYNQFSSADLNLAQKNPDAGMSILKYKQDYAKATTDQERRLANSGAEGVRSSYGNYKGSGDGGSFHLDPLSPSSFQSDSAPTYSSKYDRDIKDLYSQQKNYGTYRYDTPAPTYNNRYDDTIQDLMEKLINREEFSYDAATDPLYSQYRKAYTREGQRATQDALGAAAAASGGLPSSYAQTAASQAGNYYAAQMTDKIPELYQMAYNKYLNDYNMQLSNLGVVQGQERSDYDKYLNQLNQWNTDRNFDYNAWTDRYNMIGNNLNTAMGLEQADYGKHLDRLNQYNRDREFNYGVLLDEINSQAAERSEALNKALTAAEYGDTSFLRDMGINTANNPEDYQRKYNTALLAAEYGDFSGLRALGINPQTAAGRTYGATSRSSGGSGRRYTSSESGYYGDDMATESGASLGGSISPKILNALANNYPDGVVTNSEQWESLVNLYGEEALAQAGYTNGTGEWAELKNAARKMAQSLLPKPNAYGNR